MIRADLSFSGSCRFNDLMGVAATCRTKTFLGLLALVALAVTLAAGPASATMHTEKLRRYLCKTTGGGKFVRIPGFQGERIDRRLLPDIAWMVRRYDIFITDGYSTDPVHAANGEHPIGLATDIVPYFSRGGTWNEIGDLAHWAEPEQDHPRMPFRWVGWNGDAGHGRGNHLHLSWSHSPTEPRVPARVVYTRFCPNVPGTSSHHHRHDRSSGSGGTPARDGGGGSGGIGPNTVERRAELSGKVQRHAIAPAVPETGE
jgi:hypothetical protein